MKVCVVNKNKTIKFQPPQFESYLPTIAKRSLLGVFLDITLSPEERSRKINEVFDSLPQEIVSRLPLPDGRREVGLQWPTAFFSGYERLSADVYARIAYVRQHTVEQTDSAHNKNKIITK